MQLLSLIESKRDGQKLSADQISQFVTDYTAGRLPDYQVAAFLMAIYFRGLDRAERTSLTLAMRNSGETLSFSPDPQRPLVDKHSTGGVGDKVSLPLAPLLAALGFRVPMISGRGLGITGGTLDKLDSIPGFRTLLPRERICEIVESNGAVICGQTERMVPADKGLYALRDVTATVPSIPLIVASILSKKLAEGLEALVLDVKFGRAAFMPRLELARELAQAMVELGKECGVQTRALLTGMDVPIGRCAGNWLEIKEAVQFLESKGEEPGDLACLVIDCAAHLLVQTAKSPNLSAARLAARQCLQSGEPLAKWAAILEAQGTDLEAYYARLSEESGANSVQEVTASRAGFVSQCDARLIGEVVRDLGAGRMVKDATLDPYAGVDCLAKPGQAIRTGDLLCRVHAANPGLVEQAAERIAAAFELSEDPPVLQPVVRECVL